MHERTRIADELDYPHCPNCGEALTLADARAGETHCPMHRTDTLEDLSPDYPTDDDLSRRDAQIYRGYRHLAAWIATGSGIFAGLLVLAVGLMLLTRDVQAQEPATTLTAPYAINGRIYEWPAIGTPEYSRSCSVYRAWEDGSAYATCWEDGANYVFDPEDGEWTPMSSTR